MRKIRLRTKFLLSLLAITAGLTSGALLMVRYRIQNQVRQVLQEDLRNSVNTYRAFDRQRQEELTRSAALLANLPIVRALMSTKNAATIQDGAKDIWRLSGSDLLVLAEPSANVVAIESNGNSLPLAAAGELLRHSLERGNEQDWWFSDNRLYQIWIQPIYFGAPSQGTTLGFMAIGHEVNEPVARELSDVAASEVAFRFGDSLVVGTLPASQQAELERRPPRPKGNTSEAPVEIQLGAEKYLLTTVALSSDGPVVSLSVLKSFDKATEFVSQLNGVLVGLGLVSILAGSALVFLISDTFTKPLANLVVGVRALEQGDFTYPLESSGGDEVAEVTAAFDRMRVTLQTTEKEQKLLEQQLRQAHKMEAVGRLAGGVAHDFNNLLTIIRGHGDLLIERSKMDDSQRRSIEQIQKAADRAVSLTRQLLAFSRMQVLQPRVLDLNAVVADMGKMLPRLIGEHIQYSFQPSPELAPVKADPGQIEQVIMNLAVNARDAMPEGGALQVRTLNIVLDEAEVRRRPMTPGPYVLLSVKDSGHGMDAETQAHIFEPFFTTKEVGKGTGLGLATVYGVVKQSGGFIWVESAIGKGTTFEIYLPPASGKITESAMEDNSPAISRGSETILVVEDEDGVRELACQFLKVGGYSVLEARDGVEALEVAARHAGVIHLVLSDVLMPRMGGPAFAKQLQETRPDIKIILMSGYAEYSGTQQGQSPSQGVVLQKPFSLSSLIGAVSDVLQEKPLSQMSNVV